MTTKKVLRPFEERGATAGYTFYCPGCDETHQIWTRGRLVWEFNGDLLKPTFSPSVRVKGHLVECCHFFIRQGRIEYCSDSTHELAGKTVEMTPNPFTKEW